MDWYNIYFYFPMHLSLCLVVLFCFVLPLRPYIWDQFSFDFNRLFRIFFIVTMRMTNFLSFCLWWKVIFLPLYWSCFLKYIFIYYEILGWQLFSFSIVKIYLHCLLALIFTVEKLSIPLFLSKIYHLLFSCSIEDAIFCIFFIITMFLCEIVLYIIVSSLLWNSHLLSFKITSLPYFHFPFILKLISYTTNLLSYIYMVYMQLYILCVVSLLYFLSVF